MKFHGLVLHDYHISPHRWPGQNYPSNVIVHSTRGGVDDGGDYTRTINWFLNPDSKVSTHFLIGHGGQLAQFAEVKDSCWHAGAWNNRSIGIELAQELTTTPYTDAQYDKLQILGLAIEEHVGIKFDREHWLGHEEVDSAKSDPGALFDWGRLFATASSDYERRLAAVEARLDKLAEALGGWLA